MSTLLRYDLTTDPFPLQASPAAGNANEATLTVVASNPNADPVNNPVTVQGFGVTIPVGPDAAQLTADATNVGPVPPDGWTLTNTKKGDGTIEYVFTPQAGHGSVGKQGLAFVFNNVTVNSQPGTCTVTVKEGSSGNPTKQLLVTKFPNRWGAVSFWVDPPNVPFGGSSTLHWSGPAGTTDDPTTYTIEYALGEQVVNVPAPGGARLAPQGTYQTPALDFSTVFTLGVTGTISGQSYQAQLQHTVTVELPPPTITRFAGTLQTEGISVVLKLSWETTNADHCSLTGVAQQLDPSSPPGGFNVAPTVANPLLNSYTLTAVNSSGQATSQLSLVWGERVTSFRLDGGVDFSIATSPDNTRVAVGGQNVAQSSILSLLDAATLEPTGPPATLTFQPAALAYSADGLNIYAGDGHVSIHVFNAQTLQPVGQPMTFPLSGSSEDDGVLGIAASPDGSRLYAVCRDRLQTFDVRTRAAVGPLLKLPSLVGDGIASLAVDVAVSPDGKRVYVCALQGAQPYPKASAIVTYEATSDQNNPLTLTGFHSFPGNAYSFYTAAISPDGSVGFAGIHHNVGQQGSMMTFTPADLTPGPTFDSNASFWPGSLAVSPDGSRLFVDDNAYTVLVYVPSGVTGGTGG